MNSFGRIGVLLGGPSSEREVSLKSGNAAFQALQKAGHDVMTIDAVGDIARKIQDAGISVAFIALHGRFGEDGAIQAILEALRIPYTGSGPLASAMALDKERSRRVFKKAGLSVPTYVVVMDHKDPSAIARSITLGYPLVIKPACEGSSIGLTIVNDKAGLSAALDKAFHYDEKVIVEQYIEGKEITVGILEEKPLPVIEIRPKNKFYDFHAKYTKGMTEYIVPAQITAGEYAAAQEAGSAAHKALGCSGFSRVDMIVGSDGTPVILEVNTIPGLTETSLLPKAAAAAGIDFTALCEKLVGLAYEKNQTLEKEQRA